MDPQYPSALHFKLVSLKRVVFLLVSTNIGKQSPGNCNQNESRQLDGGLGQDGGVRRLRKLSLQALLVHSHHLCQRCPAVFKAATLGTSHWLSELGGKQPILLPTAPAS